MLISVFWGDCFCTVACIDIKVYEWVDSYRKFHKKMMCLDFPFWNTTGDIIFVYFLLFVDLDYHLLLSRNTKYLIGCLISQHSNDIWLTFCNDLHSKCKSYLFKYSSKICSHNRKQLMFDMFCYSQPTSICISYLEERHINWIFIH